MEIIARRSGEQLVLDLAGRMDGTGAQQVTSAIQQNLNDHDTCIIFDLGGVDYLSSAGLRVFQDIILKMKERKGKVIVCRLQDFVRKLLSVGGFLTVLEVYPTVKEALAATTKKPPFPAGEIRIDGKGWSLSPVHLSDNFCTLAVTGSLRRAREGKVTKDDMQQFHGSARGFSVGIGAMGKDRDMAAPLLGEMVTFGRAVYWMPTDGNLTPDFFTCEDLKSSGIMSFSLFHVAFTGPFTDMLRISSEKPEGVTLAEVYEGIFRYAKQKYPQFKGICAVTMKATIGALCSSDMKTSLLAASADKKLQAPVAMPGGKTVTRLPFDRTVAEKISVIDVTGKYPGDVLISVGYGIDLGMAGKAFSSESLAPLYFTDERTDGDAPFLSNKGVVFKDLPWDNALDFEAQLETVSEAKEFVAMHNLLNMTRVRSALIGISPVSSIRQEK